MIHKLCNLLSFFLVLLAVNTASVAAQQSHDPCLSLIHKKIPRHTTQMVIVKSLGGIKANLNLCQRQGNTWQAVFSPSFSAVIGKHGIAAPGEKKEGDLKTPAGIYPIGVAFGSEPLALKMDYKYITAEDKFIDDVHSKYYNEWITGPTAAKSYETMLNQFYQYGAVINYNMNPRVTGAGSAIFIHLWLSSDSPTHGCIAMSKKHVLMLLHSLDKKQQPHIMISSDLSS